MPAITHHLSPNPIAAGGEACAVIKAEHARERFLRDEPSNQDLTAEACARFLLHPPD